MKTMLCRPCLQLAIVALCASVVRADSARGGGDFLDRGLTGLALALRRLDVGASVLWVVAHPDDENNGLLVELARVRGLRCGLLTLTRGEGGQNEIGPELGDALGLLRTGELLSCHRLDGVEQYFGRAYEFGYSFSVEETFETWGREETLEDIVRVVRHFRPDVIITMMPTGSGGGQHHQASAILATEAFEVAADGDRFAHLAAEGLRPWRASKLYRAPFVRGEAPEGALEISIGRFDPWLGMSPAELGARARNLHRCQGMNRAPVPGPASAWLLLAASRLPESKGALETDLMQRIPSGLSARWSRFARARELELPRALTGGIAALGKAAETCRAHLEAGEWQELPECIASGLDLVRRLRELLARGSLDTDLHYDFDHALELEERDWNHAAARSSFLLLEARRIPEESGRSIDAEVVAGESFLVELSLAHRGRGRLEQVRPAAVLAEGWRATRIDSPEAHETVSMPADSIRRWRFRIDVPNDAVITEPHWFRDSERQFRWRSRSQGIAALQPHAPPPLRFEVHWEVAGVAASLRATAVHREYDARAGLERSSILRVAPALTLATDVRVGLLSVDSAKRGRVVRVVVQCHREAPANAVVSLELPPGWSARPDEASVRLDGEGTTRSVEFHVQPPEDVSPGRFRVGVVARLDGRVWRRSAQLIDYLHIEPRILYRPAQLEVVVLDVRLPEGLRVGYIEGVGDDVAESLLELGVDVDLLDAEALESSDLGRFDAIVTGVRAYKGRNDLVANNGRLLEYVHAGGTLVIQYNKYEFLRGKFAPFDYTIRRPHDRVTDEDASVLVLEPEHRAFNWPHHIVASDWKGWHQERGIYFLGSYGPPALPLLEIEDSFEYNRGPKRGALVVARHGEGHYVYTGLGFFRQLPRGVPGAVRLFANLLCLSREIDTEPSSD